MYQDLHIFIDLNWEHYVVDLDNQLKNAQKVINFMYQHGVSVYYTQQQLQEFLYNIGDLNENFIQSYGNIIEIILQNAIKIERKNYLFEVCFAYQNTSLNPINYCIDSKTPNSKIALYSKVQKSDFKNLLLVTPDATFEKISFNTVGKLEHLYNWIINNISKRKFNLSKKHGENGKGNWIGESCLLCSQTHAQDFLNKAIADFNEKTKNLFYYDQCRNAFIEFYFEGNNPQNQWHGFHTLENLWEKRIPKSVRIFFGK